MAILPLFQFFAAPMCHLRTWDLCTKHHNGVKIMYARGLEGYLGAQLSLLQSLFLSKGSANATAHLLMYHTGQSATLLLLGTRNTSKNTLRPLNG